MPTIECRREFGEVYQLDDLLQADEELAAFLKVHSPQPVWIISQKLKLREKKFLLKEIIIKFCSYGLVVRFDFSRSKLFQMTRES